MRCTLCKKKKSILLDCNYCKNEYCSTCIDISKHLCDNLNDYKEKKRNELKNKLNSERTLERKIIKI
jgi:predicted nucleic acid binding AN1-type Zn finger protein